MSLSIQIIQVPVSETAPQREFFLNGPEFKIGRNFASDVCLPDQSGQISRTHTVLKTTLEGGYVITNTSTNGTALNGNDMSSQETLPVADGYHQPWRLSVADWNCRWRTPRFTGHKGC